MCFIKCYQWWRPLAKKWICTFECTLCLQSERARFQLIVFLVIMNNLIWVIWKLTKNNLTTMPSSLEKAWSFCQIWIWSVIYCFIAMLHEKICSGLYEYSASISYSFDIINCILLGMYPILIKSYENMVFCTVKSNVSWWINHYNWVR